MSTNDRKTRMKPEFDLDMKTSYSWSRFLTKETLVRLKAYEKFS